MKTDKEISLPDLLFNPNAKIDIEHDLYGFSSDVDIIERYLEDCQSPYTIGIYGSWGSGKTTLKNFIIDQINKNQSSKIFPFDFNAWEYEQQTGILIPLISRLIKEAGLEASKIKKISSIVALAFSDLLLKASTANMMDLSDIVNFEEYANENFFKYAEYINNIEKTRDDFQIIIEEIIKKKQKQKKQIEKMVIFIDELDRCNPENTLKILESMKNYFDVEGCIFVIFVDDEILASYINKKYEDTKMDGQMYLEKIINIKFRIPKITKKKLNRLLKKIKVNLKIDVETEIFLETPKIYNPRKISKVMEKLKLFFQRNEGYDISKFPEKIASQSGEQRNKMVLLIILLHEIYPKLYHDLNTWVAGFRQKIKTTLNQCKSDPSAPGYDKLKEYFDYESEEIFLLSYIFEIFKPDTNFDIMNEMLKEIQII